MINAVARGFRWREMLESGTHATITDLARAERIDHSYVGRVMRVTLSAPGIVEAILAGRQEETLILGTLMRPLPAEWKHQEATFDILRKGAGTSSTRSVT